MKTKRHAIKPLLHYIKAHEATGHVTLHEHAEKMKRAVQRAAVSDTRFTTIDPELKKSNEGNHIYNMTPYVMDVTTPDEVGQHHAIIRTASGQLVRHGFDYNKDIGEAKLVEGDLKPTESTMVYASQIERHDLMIKAREEIISCRFANGTQIQASEPWTPDKPVTFIYVPGGVTTISAGFRKDETIKCSVQVDEETAKDLQESFDYVCSTEKQEPYADEDHEAKKATLRFPADKVKFSYGTIKSHEGVIVQGAEPTSYGAEAVNGKVYRSWSPEFATDADYTKAKKKNKHWTFPEGVRGSESNPARIIALNFVTGALTNKPAFHNMPPVKARKADGQTDNAIDMETIRKAFDGDTEAQDTLKATIEVAWPFLTNNIKAHWTVQKKGDKWHVIKKDGTDEGASDSKEKAEAHLRALYANSPDMKASGRYIVAAHEADRITLNDLQERVCKAAKADERFSKPDEGQEKRYGIWCCDIVLDKDTDDWTAIIRTANDKLHEVPFTISEQDGSVILEQGEKEVNRKTEYIEACDKSEFLLNGEIIKAGAPIGNTNAAGEHEISKMNELHEKWMNSTGEEARAIGKEYSKVMPHTYLSKHESGGFVTMHQGLPIHAHPMTKQAALEHAHSRNIHPTVIFHSGKYHPIEDVQKATDAKPTPIETIFARNQSQREKLDAIAAKCPTVKAREEAANRPPNQILESIFAKKQQQEDFQQAIINRNPLLVHREALDKISERAGK